MAGGMGVTKNKFIEDWASRRENAERYFKFSRANWMRLAVFGFALPMAVYHVIANEMSQRNSLADNHFSRTLGARPGFLFYPFRGPNDENKQDDDEE